MGNVLGKQVVLESRMKTLIDPENKENRVVGRTHRFFSSSFPFHSNLGNADLENKENRLPDLKGGLDG